MVEGAQRSLGALAHGDHDLLVRHRGHVAGGEDAGQRGLATGVDDDLAARRQLDAALEPLGVGQQADLHEDTFQLDRLELLGVAVLVHQAGDLLAVALHFAGQGTGDHLDVRQAVELALQHGVGAQLAVEFQQGHVGDDAGQVDGRLDARVAAADHRHALALEQRAVAVRAEAHALGLVFLLAGHAHFAPASAGGEDQGLGLEAAAALEPHLVQLAGVLRRNQLLARCRFMMSTS